MTEDIEHLIRSANTEVLRDVVTNYVFVPMKSTKPELVRAAGNIVSGRYGGRFVEELREEVQIILNRKNQVQRRRR